VIYKDNAYMSIAKLKNRSIPWYYVYYALAVFNILVISSSIYLNHRIVEIFNEFSIENKEWIVIQSEVIELSALSLAMRGPGNELFASKDVAGESKRFDDLHAEYKEKFTEVYNKIESEKTEGALYKDIPIKAAEMDAILHGVARAIPELRIVVFRIFESYAKGDIAQASIYRADIYKTFSLNASRLNSVSKKISEMLAGHLQYQESLASNIEAIENLIAIIALIAVSLAIIYGLVLSKKMKSAEIELLKHRDHLQEMVNEQTGKLIQEKMNAEAANRMKSDFLSNMSHELRTPMHAILSYSDMGLEKLAKKGLDEKEKLEKYLGNIKISGKRLLGLLNNILDISKIESEGLSLKVAEDDFKEVVEHAHIELDSLLKEKNIVMVTNISTEDTKALFDRTRIIQVMINLLSNAIKFSPNII
jgi:signal transduction histidine kinase